MIVRVDGAELPSYRAEQPHPSRSSSFAAKHESGNCPANEPDAKHEDGGNGRRVDTTYVAEEPEDEAHGKDQPANSRISALVHVFCLPFVMRFAAESLSLKGSFNE